MTDWRSLNDTVLNLTVVLLLVEIVCLLYFNSIDGEFVFDDTSVVEALMPEIIEKERGR